MSDDQHSVFGYTMARRRWIATLGSAASIGIAGCTGDDTTPTTGDGDDAGDSGDSGNGDDGDDTDTPTDGPQQIDRKLQYVRGKDYSEVQYNTYNPTNFVGSPVSNFLWDSTLTYKPRDGEFINFIVSDFSADGDTISLNLDENYQWHNGDPLTARDLTTQYELDLFQQEAAGSEHPYINSVSMVDDYQMDIQYHEEYNLGLVVPITAGGVLSVNHDVYEEYLEGFQDASDDDAMTAAAEDLTTFRWEDPIGNGPFEIVNADPESLTMDAADNYAYAENVNFNGLHSQDFGEDAAANREIQNGNADFSPSGAPQQYEVEDIFPEDTLRIPHDSEQGGWGLFFNHSDDLGGNRGLRKAFQYLIDVEALIGNTNVTAGKLEVPQAGINNAQFNYWLSDYEDEFEMAELSHEKAEQALRDEAGFEKQGGSWRDTDGNTIDLELAFPSGWSGPGGAMQTIKAQMDEIGLGATLRGVDPTSFTNMMLEGNYQIGTWFWGSSHPFFSYSDIFLPGGLINGFAELPDELEAPPVGEPDGELQTYDVTEGLQFVATSRDEEEIRETFREYAWIFNNTMPYVQLTKNTSYAWVYRPDRFNFLEEDIDPAEKHAPNPVYNGPRLGWFGAVE